MIAPFERRARPRRDPDDSQGRLRRRFAAVSRRIDRAAMLRRLQRQAGIAALAIMGVATLVMGLTLLFPWPLPASLRHMAALPGCDAAHAVGLAPSARGEPGYWRRLDADGDGRSCERWADGRPRTGAGSGVSHAGWQPRRANRDGRGR